MKDHFLLGLLLGLLAPTLGILGFYLFNFSDKNLFEFLELSVSEKLLSPLLSLSCVINLGVFYLFIHFERYSTSRGIIFSTFIYGFAIVVLKFFI
ncbi:MAG: hypothetical protein LCH37_03530 [Bacteroidetes bacterium]|nr:hypothetical protein [Bacteroidota bacterium]